MTSLNLNGKLWSNSDSVGKQLIQKLGWTEGEGLGKNKQGSVSHVKVSLKNDRDGIGMKSGKYSNNCGLLQTFNYDMQLKTKYAEVKGEKCEESIPRSMARPKFGRAVRPDYFTPLNNDDWTKILGKSETNDNNHTKSQEPITIKIETVIPKKETPKSEQESTMENKFVTKKINVNEYFEMKMKLKMAKINGQHIESVRENKRSCSPSETESPARKKSKIDMSTNECTEVNLSKKKKKKDRNEQNAAPIEVTESEISEVKPKRSKKRKSERESDSMNLEEKMEQSEAKLCGIADLLANEPMVVLHQKAVVAMKEVPKTEPVKIVIEEMAPPAQRVWPLGSPLDTSNIRDIRGYKYY